MTKTEITFYILGIGAVLAFAYLLATLTPSVGASAPSGLPANIATTTNPTVGTTAALVFATSSCASRSITTSANPIMITFSDYLGQTPTATFGHLQAASTTVVYDSGQWGCGAVKIYGYTGNQVLTVTESR